MCIKELNQAAIKIIEKCKSVMELQVALNRLSVTMVVLEVLAHEKRLAVKIKDGI